MPVLLLGQKITLRALKNENKDKIRIKKEKENTEDFLYSFPKEKKDKLPDKHEMTCSLCHPFFLVKGLCQETTL